MLLFMRKLYLTLAAIGMLSVMYAQEIQITDHDPEYRPVEQQRVFEALMESFERQQAFQVATLEGEVIHTLSNNLVTLFNGFWRNGNELGANAFWVEEVEHSNGRTRVRMSVYHLTPDQQQQNMALYTRNMVYVFGDLNPGRNRSNRLMVNGQRHAMGPLDFVAISNTPGQELELSMRGMSQAKTTIKGRPDRPSEYFSTQEFGVGPNFGPDVSLSMRSGRFFPVRQNFAHFLLRTLEKE